MTTLTQGLTAEQRETLATVGLLRLPAAVPPADTAALADLLWAKLKSKHGIDRERRETWTRERPAQLAGPVYDAAASPALLAVIDSLLGPGRWTPPPRWGTPLVCFPNPDRVWTVPHFAWHLDAPATAEEPAIVRAFTLLAPLGPGGGGTVCVAGSHRILMRLARGRGPIPSAKAKAMLVKREPWFAALLSPGDPGRGIERFMHEGVTMDGVNLRVVEMTGEAGDVILMHPLTLHSSSSNVRDTPRLVITHWIYGRDAAA